MHEARDSRSQSPHGVAMLAALLVLGAGFGVGAYFVELRGIGLSALLAGDLAPELVLLAGAVLAMAVVVQLHVARAARRADPTRALRTMLRQALSCLEAGDGEPVAPQGLPAEMHDLVGVVAAEKNRTQEARREVQAMRREVNELLLGLERSAAAHEPLREDTQSEFGQRVARAWNDLLERRESSRRQTAPDPDSMNLDLGTSPLRMPQEAAAAELQSLSARLSRLEASVEQLRDAVRSSSMAPASAARPGMQPSVLAVPELPASEALADLRFATRPTLHRPAPEVRDEAAPSAFAPHEDTYFAGAAPEAASDEIAHSRSEVAPPSTPASASGYHEWTGRSAAQQGSWRLQEEAETALQSQQPETDAGFERTPTFGATPPAFVDDTYVAAPGARPLELQRSTPFQEAHEPEANEPSPETQADEEFRFPHFVARPGGGVEGRVAVTFEGGAAAGAAPAPAGGEAAGPAGRSLIVDLRELGAVELEE
jgi:hypothetical protein